MMRQKMIRFFHRGHGGASWFRVLMAIGLVVLAAGCMPAAGSRLGERPAIEPLDATEAYLQRFQPGPTPRVFQTSRLYDRNGVLITERWEEGRRTWIGIDRISRHLINATVATEDATFYQNAGVDPARVFGAALQNTQEGEVVSGGSTITMQLARNLFMPPDQRVQQTMDRKMLEAGLAQELNALFSKDEVLEMYLNLLNYGHLTYGPEAAAQVYFGKSAADLTVAEATLLAGIPQQPANLDPLTDLGAVKDRQRVVLDLMVRHGYLSPADADVAFAEPITLHPDPDRRIDLAPHFSQYVFDTLNERLGDAAAVRSGLSVTTTLDLRMQRLAQSVVASQVKALQPKHDLSNGALVAMRPYSGEVLAMVGSADFADAGISGQVNVARSLRQPGSAIKPVFYATALNDDLISPATVLWDVPVTYTVSAGLIYRPANYDGLFHGPVTVRYALGNSYNIPAIKLLDGLGLDRALEGARSMGLVSLDRGTEWYGLSLTLGGGEVTLLELTTAYAVLASAGRAVAPEPVLTAVDTLGRLVAAARAATEDGASPQVISAAAAFLVTDILSDNAARTPMFGPNSVLKLSRPAAAKTGTTDDFRDNWTIGYTRHLVAGAWAGNSDGRPMKKVSGVAGAGPIWQEFMEGVLNDPVLLAVLAAPPEPEAWAFAPPEDVELRPECPPGLACRDGGEYFSRTWLAAAGDDGPLTDSVALVASAPVYAALPEAGRWTAYCSTEPAAVRPLLKLPSGLGLAMLRPARDAGPDIDPDLQAEPLHAIGWSLRHPTAVDLGPCELLADLAPRALSVDPLPGDEALQVWADLAAALDPDAGPVPGDTTLPAVAASPGDFRFGLGQPVTHHAECPGNYIVGRVLDRNGGPVAGVHIVMIDEWGNWAEAWSKGGASDYGNYDLLLNPFANRYTLTVVDEAGSPISPPAVVEHLQGESGMAPCHTVVWQGS